MKTTKTPVKPYTLFVVKGSALAPSPVGQRAKVIDLERTVVCAPDRMSASASLAKFLNDTKKFERETQGERFSATWPINCLHIEPRPVD